MKSIGNKKYMFGVCISSVFLLMACSNMEAVTNTEKVAEQAKEQVYSYDIKDQCYYTTACYTVPVGSNSVDTRKLKPYHARWTQKVPKDGKWMMSPGSFEETLTTLSGGQWQHIQKTNMGNGTAKVETRTLDRNTWQVLDMTITYENGPPSVPEKVFYDLRGDSFTADITMPGGVHQNGKERKKSLPMFSGQIGGLTLATLPLEHEYSATMPMIIPNLGIYWIEAKVKGVKSIKVASGEKIDTWEVDANWFNLTDGDIYEPGRDGDGGVYYIAKKPGDGVPYVIEYANSSAVITWDGVKRD